VGGHDQAYWIDEPTGGVSYSIAARGLDIAYWEYEEYWKWILQKNCPSARFVSIDHQILEILNETSLKKLISQATIRVFHINVKSVNGFIFNCLLA
jgi:hypothetical protein